MVRATLKNLTFLSSGRQTLRLELREVNSYSWYQTRGFRLAGREVALTAEETRIAKDHLATVQTPDGDYNHIRSHALNILSHSDLGGLGTVQSIVRALLPRQEGAATVHKENA
jgi:hypothetical protein